MTCGGPSRKLFFRLGRRELLAGAAGAAATGLMTRSGRADDVSELDEDMRNLRLLDLTEGGRRFVLCGPSRSLFYGSARSLSLSHRVDEALLTPMSVHRLDDEVLFDCDLSAQRVPVGVAKKST